MKSKRIMSLLVALGLCVSGLTGCSFGGNNSAKENSGGAQSSESSNGQGEGQSNSNPGSSSGNPSGGSSGGQNNNEDGLPIYQGDPSNEVGKINNVPVSDYSAEAKAKLLEMAKLLSPSQYEDIYNNCIKYMLKLKVGNELAILLADTVSEAQAIGMNAVNSDDKEASDKVAEDMQRVYYQLLKIINSIDPSAVCDLLTFINSETKQARQKEYEERLSIEEYANVRIGDFYYNDYLLLKKAKEETNSNNAVVNDFLTTYENALKNYNYSESTLNYYQSYVQDLKDRAEEDVIPTVVINFLKKNANKARDILVKDLKLIIDAYCSMIPEILEVASNSSVSIRNASNRLYFNGHYYYENGESTYSDSNMSIELLDKTSKLILKNKELYMGILNAIALDEDTLGLLIDAAIDVLIPMYKAGNIIEDVDNDKADALAARLKTINATQVKTFVKFLLKAFNIVDNKDLEDFTDIVVKYREEGLEEADVDFIYSLGDKYAPLLSELVNSLDANAKNDIAAIGRVIGINILDEVNAFLVIYNAKDLKTEDGQEAFFDAVQTWAGAIREALFENVLFMFSYGDDSNSDSYSPKPVEEEQQPLSFGFQEDPIMGLEFSDDNISIYLNMDSNYGYQLSGYNISEWNERVNEAKQFLIDYEKIDENEKQYYRYEYESSLEISTMEITNFVVSLDTSKCGRVPYSVAYSFQGHNYLYRDYCDVSVVGLETLEKVNLGDKYGFNNEEIYNSTGNYAAQVVFKDSDITFSYETRTYNSQYDYYEWGRAEVKVDTSKAGWNIFLQESGEYEGVYYCSVYYVVDRQSLKDHIVSESSSKGYIIEGEESFLSGAYCRVSYSYENGDIAWGISKSLYNLGEEELKNKPVNEVLTYVDEAGYSYQYVIISKNNLVDSYYSFSIYGASSDMFASDWTPEMISYYNSEESSLYFYAYLDSTYEITIDGVTSMYSTSKNLDGKPSNLNYQNGVFTFTFNNVQYSFKING